VHNPWRRRLARLYEDGNLGWSAAALSSRSSLAPLIAIGLLALTIVAASLAPVLFLHGIIVAGGPGGLQGSSTGASGGPDTAPAALLIS
jgi:hypothetical protein